MVRKEEWAYARHRESKRERERFYHCFECSNWSSIVFHRDGWIRICTRACMRWCIDAVTCASMRGTRTQNTRESIGTPQKGGSTLGPYRPIDCWMGNNWPEKHGTVRVPEGGRSAIDRLLNPFSCRPPYSRGREMASRILWSFHEVLI